MSEKTNMNAIMKKGWVVLLCALLCCLLWGSAFPCIKIGYTIFEIGSSDTGSQILFAGCRFALAGILTLAIGSVLAGKVLIPKPASLPHIGLLALFQTVIQYLFFYSGLARASGVSSSIINGSGTFFAILIASLICHQESFTRQKLLGCIFGFAGVVLVSLGGAGALGFAWNGEGFIVISALCYAISSVMIKSFGKTENPVVLSGCQFFAGGVVMILFGFGLGGHFTIGSAAGAGLLVYMAMISAVSYSLWGVLLKYNPVSRVTIYGFTNPIFGVLLSALLLGETDQLNPMCLLALLLVSAGIYVVNRAK